MSKPLLSIRVDIRVAGRPAEAWGIDVPAEAATPTQIEAAIEDAFAKLRAKALEATK